MKISVELFVHLVKETPTNLIFFIILLSIYKKLNKDIVFENKQIEKKNL